MRRCEKPPLASTRELPPCVGESQAKHRLVLGAYLFLIALALACFVYRGPLRALTHVCPDLPVFYASGIAWLSGEDPYNTETLNHIFHDRGGPAGGRCQILLNPPSSLPFFSLLAAFSYPVANSFVATMNVLLVVFILICLFRLFGEAAPVAGSRRAFILFVIAWAPLHTSIAQGQNTILTMALLLAGVCLVDAGRQLAAGAVFALAATIRPSFFFVFVLWYLLSIRRCLKLAASATVVAALVTTVAIARLEYAGVAWANGFLANLDAFRADQPGAFGVGTGSIEPDRPERFIMLNLQPLLSTWWGDGPATQYIPLLFALVLACVAWWFHRQRVGPTGDGKLEPIDLSFLCLLTLLMVYNRFYSAVLLLVPLAWALSMWHDREYRWLARGMVLLMTVFLVPGVAISLRFLPDATLHAWWCRLIVLPHQTYALLLLVALFSVALWRKPVGAILQRPLRGSTDVGASA